MKKYIYTLFLGTMSLVHPSHASNTDAEAQQQKKEMSNKFLNLLNDLKHISDYQIPNNYEEMNDAAKQEFDDIINRLAIDVGEENFTNASFEHKKNILVTFKEYIKKHNIV